MLRFVLPLLASGAAAAPEQVVPRHGTAEIVLHAAQSYNGASGSPNPFTSVTLELEVTSPTGRTLQVEGFFDGDGLGGQIGDVFVARVYADELGIWSWTAASSDAGLHGESGSFTVSGTLPGRWGRGGLGFRASNPRHFFHADGTPFFVAGKMLDSAQGGNVTQSLTMLSEVWTDDDRRDLLDRAHSLSARKMGVYVANRGDFSSQWPVTPWLGTAAANDKTRFDLARWKMFDAWTRTMRDEGFATQFYFFADNSSFGSLPIADRLRLIRYGMARLSAYANTYFIVTLEWDEGWSVEDVDTAAEALQAGNPWDRPVSTHCLPGLFDFPDRAWADYMPIQSAAGTSYSVVHQRNLDNRALAVKPPVDDEFGLGAEDLLSRQSTWAALTAGVAGIGTANFLPQLMTLVSQIEVERMAPDDGLVTSGTAYVLAERGRQYVAYLPIGGSVTLSLSHTSGTLQARWFHPVNGTFQNQVNVQAGGSLVMNAPASGDWVLHLRRPCTANLTPGLVTGLRVDPADTVTWDAASGAHGYDTVAGDLESLRAGGIGGSLRACLERNGPDTTAKDPTVPAEGGGRYYLVRARSCDGSLGSYDDGGPAPVEPRDAAAAASSNDCP